MGERLYGDLQQYAIFIFTCEPTAPDCERNTVSMRSTAQIKPMLDEFPIFGTASIDVRASILAAKQICEEKFHFS